VLPGKFTDYYWRLSTFLAEKEVILDKAHPDHRFPEDDSLVYYTRYLEGCLVFVDGSRLRFEVALSLDEQYNVIERRYFYGYYDREGTRVLQYDNSAHHSDLASHPHHVHRGPVPAVGNDRAFELDIPRADFVAVFSKVEELVQMGAIHLT
jgi:hypothetical protein